MIYIYINVIIRNMILCVNLNWTYYILVFRVYTVLRALYVFMYLQMFVFLFVNITAIRGLLVSSELLYLFERSLQVFTTCSIRCKKHFECVFLWI